MVDGSRDPAGPAGYGTPETRMERAFPRAIAALESLFGFAREFFRESGLGSADPADVELILEELFTNLVKYNETGQHPIEVGLRYRGDVVEMVLRDRDVEPYDVTRAPAVDVAARLAAGRPGGLGLHLVRCMAESLTYEYRDRTSTITATWRLGR